MKMSNEKSSAWKSPTRSRSDMSTASGTRTFKVSVEGNIASGKSTFLDYFNLSPDVEVRTEPVEKWRNLHGHNMLALLYKDPTRWALSLQTYVQLTMLQMHTKPHERPITIMERSIFSARHCFVENLYHSGKMPTPEYIVLDEWYQWLVANTDVHVDLIVYLRTRPEVCLARMYERDRKEENKVPLAYLNGLHELHENWLVRQVTVKPPAPVLVLDANSNMSDMEHVMEEYREKIMGRS
ncbi:PREDICTED: thymidine kinase 2, mitochondrial-like [Priapulus caudatus]|uniref:Thymidine kinase 2, mitochondrial-like n=1 Tax=Priapulus caudatus TaxID=37621 RepID=A0ABM1EDU7_PRICU|nr:PREDICTED: thymidine kinase 2, mitochondrial-like [Priapulus caudatus]XP_014670368.1 PREDICTED: thymidine kinase 2, mitochondrial-like [Priapulus caudatus]